LQGVGDVVFRCSLGDSVYSCAASVVCLYRSTANDLKMLVRLIKHDLRINAGAKHM